MALDELGDETGDASGLFPVGVVARAFEDDEGGVRERREQPVLVVAHAEWHVGVIGIVAGRIAEHYQRPAIVIALDEQKQTGQGSGRTHGGFDLHAALTACGEHLERFGGHKAAAGLHLR